MLFSKLTLPPSHLGKVSVDVFWKTFRGVPFEQENKIDTTIYVYPITHPYGAVPDCMYVDLCLFWEANILGTQSCVVGMQS